MQCTETVFKTDPETSDTPFGEQFPCLAWTPAAPKAFENNSSLHPHWKSQREETLFPLPGGCFRDMDVALKRPLHDDCKQ